MSVHDVEFDVSAQLVDLSDTSDHDVDTEVSVHDVVLSDTFPHSEPVIVAA